MSGLQSSKQIPGSCEIALDTVPFDPANFTRESHGTDTAGNRFQLVTNDGGLPGSGHPQRGLQLRQGLGRADLKEADQLHKEIGRSTGRQAPQFRDHRWINLGERIIHDAHLNPRLTPTGRRHL
jgi:hypothetical protein